MEITEETEPGRRRVMQLFRYLQAYHQMRNPILRTVQDHSWRLWFRELPTHSCVRIGTFEVEGDDENTPVNENGSLPSADTVDDFVLRVSRPNLKPAPEPPKEIADWVLPGWEKIEGQIRITPELMLLNEEGERVPVALADDPERVIDLEVWREQRRLWQEAEHPAYDTMTLFERLYMVYGALQREAERLELVLGDGILDWKREEGSVHYPLLLQQLQMEFEPKIPEFTLRQTEISTEFYSALFQEMPDVDGVIIAKFREELQAGNYHPLNEEATSAFLKSLVTRLSAKGEFVEGEPTGSADFPRVGRSPVILLRNRTAGFATALESILQQLPETSELPASLLHIVGTAEETQESGISNSLIADSEFIGANTTWGTADVLLSKPANAEQIQIAERLQQYGCVLVQGPPGTGKTHTIANLIGHLLAQGKTILVTSHTAKALRVLREQVVVPLQPLCVSVLESDSAGRSQLETSVGAIVGRLSSSNAEQLEGEANRLKTRRLDLLEQLTQLDSKILSARDNEYRSLVIAGREVTPADAARMIAAGQGKDDWIPVPVAAGGTLPLSASELTELYASNTRLHTGDESQLSGPLPELGTLPTPDVWVALLQEWKQYAAQAPQSKPEYWQRAITESDSAVLGRIHDHLERETEPLAAAEAWELKLVEAGKEGERKQLWVELLTRIEQVTAEARKCERIILEREPTPSVAVSPVELERILTEIITHLGTGKSLNFVALLTKPQWKPIINSATVRGRKPETVEDFEAIQAVLRLEMSRAELARRWTRQVGAIDGPNLPTDNTTPEVFCSRYTSVLQTKLDWYGMMWEPAERALEQAKFMMPRFRQSFPPATVNPENAADLLKHLTPALLLELTGRIAAIEAARIEAEINALAASLEPYTTDGHSPAVAEVRATIAARDAVAYPLAYAKLAELIALRGPFERRRSLLKTLESAAPGWSAALRERIEPHDLAQIPGNVEDAWLWRQASEELARRDRESPESLERQREQLGIELRTTTAELVENKAWAAQIRRTTLPQRQALMGWLNLVKKIGKATGKKAPRLQREARERMQDSRSSVPVWIMPISRLAENFDPATTRFDVVIIDEASQADATGLIPLYMADAAVIVGDNEQVSPDAVGESVERTIHLVDEHLQGIPNAVLYDGQRSIYDIALESFGGHICLTEHFRCAAEIIQFSNGLCYNGKINPLRDMSAVLRRPAVIPYRVSGGTAYSKVNETEAKAVVSLMMAAMEQPEYVGATFGAISLVGEEQARTIDTLLLRYLTPDDYQKRRVMCGTPPQFQGDERDVMFLSVVDSPQGGPLTMREDGANGMYKKRYNVAASRARDQMWVVYSLQYDIDLKPGDIRRRLIEHALDPAATLRRQAVAEQRAESEFERQVMRRLIGAGYRVTPQWAVGRYRIDMVVEDGVRRLAVECDGDRYHPMEKLGEDMARQALLERLGWTFARIRGSAFFRDPDSAIEPVFEKLRRLGIEPIGMEDSTESAASTDELTQRIIRRAEQIRWSWENPKGASATNIEAEDNLYAAVSVKADSMLSLTSLFVQ